MSQQQRQRLSWDAMVEERIRQAQAEGQFDGLPLGQKCAAIDEPYDEMWWVRRFLRREGLAVLPISLEISRDVERELARIFALVTEEDIRAAVVKLNERIRAANYRAVSGPPSTTCLLQTDEVLEQWRSQKDLSAEFGAPSAQ